MTISKNNWMILMGGFMTTVISMFIRPTMDDWGYLCSPHIDVMFPKSLLPLATYWRPFDGLLGIFNSEFHFLFPYLNHLLIGIAHTINAFLIYKISQQLEFPLRSQITATLFFMLCPGIQGTVLDIDSVNQAYSLLFGLVTISYYLSDSCSRKVWKKHLTMGSLILISALWKENGLIFFLIPPILAYGIGRKTLRQALSDTTLLFLYPCIYLCVRLSLSDLEVVSTGVYTEGGIGMIVRNIGMFLLFPWLPLDYVSILHAPSRNILLTALTLGLTLPYIGFIIYHIINYSRPRLLISLFLCLFLIVGIHLITIFTVMHSYSAISISALIIGALVSDTKVRTIHLCIAALWITSAIISDAHHIIKAYQSGEMGHNMALSTISQMKEPVDKCKTVIIETNYPKYSMFCVIPYDAFGYGVSVQYENDYTWPKEIEHVFVADNSKEINNAVSVSFAEGYPCVWLVRDTTVRVIYAPDPKLYEPVLPKH